MFLIFLFFSSCNKKITYEKNESSGTALKVITTLFPLYDFSKEVGKDKVQVSLLLPPGVEAHGYEPAPQDIVRIENADVFVYTGKYMEVWAGKILSGIANSNLVIADTSTGIILTDHGKDGHHQHETKHSPDAHANNTHAAAHQYHQNQHGSKDPHFWLDPVRAQTMINTIAGHFSKADPLHETVYKQNARDYNDKLAALDKKLKNTFSNCRHNVIVCGGHFVFGYFVTRYNLTHISPYSGFSPNSEPTAKNIAELIKTMRTYGIQHIFYEELLEPRTAKIIAEETGAKMLLLHGAHNISKKELSDGITYLDIMQANLENLKTGLEYVPAGK